MPPRRDLRWRSAWWKTVTATITLFVGLIVYSRRPSSLEPPSNIVLPDNLHLIHSGALSPLSFAHAKRHRLCMFFDWPPWTRSSVVAHTLHECWEKRHGFEMAEYDDYTDRARAMSTMINLSSPFVAMVGQHMHLSADELDLMKHSCDYRYYVTAARRVEERIFYQYKSELLGSKYISNVDVQLSNDTINRVKKLILTGKTASTISKLERYPFDNQTLGPDYVVRAFYFSDDVWALFDAFNCTDLLPDPSVDVASKYSDNAVFIEDVYDSTSIFNFQQEKNESEGKDVLLTMEEEEGEDDEEPEPSSAPKRWRPGDLFLPESPPDVMLAKLLHKGVASGEITYRKLRGHGHRHNERGLQKIKEILALRYNQLPDIPIDKEAIDAEKFAVFSDDDSVEP